MINLNDENFQQEIEKIDLALVDFFAVWCEPCKILEPILEKVADDLKDQITLVKVNVDQIPKLAQQFQISRIPLVALFKKGKPIDAFVGLKSDEEIKEWILKNEYKEYAKENNFKLNPEKAENIIKGLLNNEKKYGKRYCPCRRVTGDEKEDAKNICPCIYHKKEIEQDGQCFCGLFTK